MAKPLTALTLLLPAGALCGVTFTVTNTNDAGPGSLREAILVTNATPGADLIAFSIPGPGVHTIALASELPRISDAVTIDGYTQPGASPNTQITSDDAVLLVEINGEFAGDDSRGFFTDGAGGVTIRGLVVNRFFGTNVSAGQVEGCFIGTDPTGTISRSRGTAAGASGGSIGGSLPAQRNVISGNNGPGIWGGGLIQGNFIGINAAGTVALPNAINVLVPWGGSALIGGLATTAGTPPGNVISGSSSDGIRIVSFPGSTVTIQGNLIGTNATGSAAIANGGHGVRIMPDFEIQRSGYNAVGGTEPGAGNVIAYNGGDGVRSEHGRIVFASVLSNSIHSNVGLGISRYSPAGVASPILTAAVSSGGSTTIQGTVDTGPPTGIRIELFSSPACDPSGDGEGETLIGSATVSLGAFSIVLPVSLELGSVVTATATSDVVNTSKFSNCRTVTDGPVPPVPLSVGEVTPRSGGASGGAPVTVAGAGFLPGASLTIGGVPAGNVLVVDSTRITATTPSLPPGSLNDVTVTQAEGAIQASSTLPDGWMADFLDVPQENVFHDDVEKIFRRRATAGCGPGLFCVDSPVTREQMAVLLLKTDRGPNFAPPLCGGVFEDVPCTPGVGFSDWVEFLYTSEITGGCAADPPQFCPDRPVTRAQMAVLLLKTRYGVTSSPAPCASVFGDVVCPATLEFPYSDWIERLHTEGITAGCDLGPPLRYCPDASNLRGEMAVFLSKTFALP